MNYRHVHQEGCQRREQLCVLAHCLSEDSRTGWTGRHWSGSNSRFAPSTQCSYLAGERSLNEMSTVQALSTHLFLPPPLVVRKSEHFSSPWSYLDEEVLSPLLLPQIVIAPLPWIWWRRDPSPAGWGPRWDRHLSLCTTYRTPRVLFCYSRFVCSSGWICLDSWYLLPPHLSHVSDS